MKFKVILEEAEEGGYVIYVPSLPGCVSQGESKEEALENIKDVIKGYLESVEKHGEKVPVMEEEVVEIIA